MNVSFEEFNHLKRTNVPRIMLKSTETRGGYMYKAENTSQQRLHQVSIPPIKNGFIEKYCKEY